MLNSEGSDAGVFREVGVLQKVRESYSKKNDFSHCRTMSIYTTIGNFILKVTIYLLDQAINTPYLLTPQ